MGFSVKSRKIIRLISWFFILFGVICLALGIVSLVTQRTLEELWSGYRSVAPYTGGILEGWKGRFLIGVALGASGIITGILLRFLINKTKHNTQQPPDTTD